MIEPTLIGRLGNFLFEVAAAYAYSLRHNMEYNVNKREDINNYIDRFFPQLETSKELPSIHAIWKEPSHAYTEIPKYKDVKILEYFQSELYFKDFRNEVLALFNFPYDKKEGWTSLHVRRGDYVTYHTRFPPVPMTYLNTAMRLMERNGYTKFLIFSDDMMWCKTHMNEYTHPNYTFEYSEGRNEFEDMALGSCCEHNIISNSTFSWWQGWLNRNPNKIVVSPSEEPGNWFGKRVTLSTKDIIPKEWVRIRF